VSPDDIVTEPTRKKVANLSTRLLASLCSDLTRIASIVTARGLGMRGARSRVRSRKAAVIALVMANAVALATLCVAAAPAWGDPPPRPDPSFTTTPPPATRTQPPAKGPSPAGTTSKSPELRQLVVPAVRLSRDHGAPGTTFSATVTGSAACRLEPVKLQWDSDTPVDVDKATATANFTVPVDAATGPHKVSATCIGKVFASSPFTVVEKPALTIDPDSGPPGSQLKATGTGFACGDDTDTVDIALDSDVRGHGSSGTFSEQVSIPATAPVGDHTVVATCHNHPDITDSQTFTVTSTTTTTVPGPNPTPVVPVTSSAELTPVPATPVPTTTAVSTKDVNDTSDLASYWWVLVLIAVAVASLGFVHHMLKLPPVHAVSRLAGPPLVTVHETPAPGESTHALRLETHSGTRTLTVEEVNDGHIPAE